VFSLRNALIMVLVLIATGLGVWIASAAYTVTAVYTIDEKDPSGFTDPVDDDCPIDMPCKVKSDLNVADNGQAIPSVTSISPGAFRGASGISIPNSAVVGRADVSWHYQLIGTCSSTSTLIHDTKDFLDGMIKGENPPTESGTIGALSDPTVWPTRLESDLRVKYLLTTTGHTLLRRSVAVIDGGDMLIDIPINLLSFDVSDGVGFGGLTLRGTYNVAVTGVPGVSLPSTCTPMTNNSWVLGETAAGLTLQTCRAAGTQTMTTVLTHDSGLNVVEDNRVSDTMSCSLTVGGIAEYPDTAGPVGKSSSLPPGALAGAAAAAAVVLVGGAWYVRRRRLS